MTLPRSVADVLASHVTLELDCIDRMYLNVSSPSSCSSRASPAFFKGHRGMPFVSSALMDPISKDFVAAIHRRIKDEDLPLVHFEKGQRKDDIAHEHLARFGGDEGVLFVGRAQERTPVFRTQKRRNPLTGAT